MMFSIQSKISDGQNHFQHIVTASSNLFIFTVLSSSEVYVNRVSL